MYNSSTTYKGDAASQLVFVSNLHVREIMFKISKSRVVILIHIFCWLLLGGGLMLSHPPDFGNSVPSVFWLKHVVLLFWLLILFYFNLYLLIPRFFIRKRIRKYLYHIVPALAISIIINSLINSYFQLNADVIVFDSARKPHTFPGYNEEIWNLFSGGMMLLVIGLGMTISLIYKWNEEVSRRQVLEQEKTAAELSMLKAQINPHFFFNTLNNIYSFTLADGEIAREAITNLSRMMRYVLYETSSDKILLSKEIDFISQYVALMKLRVTDKTDVSMIVTEPVTDLMIAPMLFLPLVENAFKHGISNSTEGFISIIITQTAETILLTVENSIHKRSSRSSSNGIGLDNTLKRLSLLYPERHTLTYGPVADKTFKAKLLLWVKL